MKSLFLIFLSLNIASISSATEAIQPLSEIKTSILKPEKEMPIERLSIFANTYPWPLFSGGIGLGAEVRTVGNLFLWFAAEKAEEGSGAGGLTPSLGEYEKVARQKNQLALRYLLFEQKQHSPFLTAGYEWVTLYSEYSPGLFGGVAATKKEKAQGAYAEIGYRIQQTQNIGWKADIALGYAPTEKVEMEYIGESTSVRRFFSFGPDKARLETKYDYAPYLRARVGYNF